MRQSWCSVLPRPPFYLGVREGQGGRGILIGRVAAKLVAGEGGAHVLHVLVVDERLRVEGKPAAHFLLAARVDVPFGAGRVAQIDSSGKAHLGDTHTSQAHQSTCALVDQLVVTPPPLEVDVGAYIGKLERCQLRLANERVIRRVRGELHKVKGQQQILSHPDPHTVVTQRYPPTCPA